MFKIKYVEQQPRDQNMVSFTDSHTAAAVTIKTAEMQLLCSRVFSAINRSNSLNQHTLKYPTPK